jgi:hypothetical protein
VANRERQGSFENEFRVLLPQNRGNGVSPIAYLHGDFMGVSFVTLALLLNAESGPHLKFESHPNIEVRKRCLTDMSTHAQILRKSIRTLSTYAQLPQQLRLYAF